MDEIKELGEIIEDNFDRTNRWKGLVIGLISGAVGLMAMRKYWQVAALN